MTSVLYLHGFKSSPQSSKACLTEAWLRQSQPQVQFLAPQLPLSPAMAGYMLEAIVQDLPSPVGLIGSSLGGYYAMWLAARSGCRAVLINPAVYPYRLLDAYRGEQSNPYTGERYLLGEEDFDALREMDFISPAAPQSIWMLLQKGDETLDYREALSKYPGVPVCLEERGSHAFTGYERHLAAIYEFLMTGTIVDGSK